MCHFGSTSIVADAKMCFMCTIFTAVFTSYSLSIATDSQTCVLPAAGCNGLGRECSKSHICKLNTNDCLTRQEELESGECIIFFACFDQNVLA